MKSFSSIVYSLCSVCWYTLFGGKLDPGVTANCDSRSQRSPLSFVWARVMRNFELCWTLIIHWGGFCIHPLISFAGYHCVAMVVVLARLSWLVLWTITITFVSSYNQYSPFQQCPVSGKSILQKKEIMGYICNMKYMGNMETWHAKIFRNKMYIQKCFV